jgi:hypothetical protein
VAVKHLILDKMANQLHVAVTAELIPVVVVAAANMVQMAVPA